MTIITNAVVALMIVTTNVQPIQGAEIMNPFDHSRFYIYGQPETLYRNTVQTNYVHIADIHTDKIKASCYERGCFGTVGLKPENLIGCQMCGIFFENTRRLYCTKHAASEQKYCNNNEGK